MDVQKRNKIIVYSALTVLALGGAYWGFNSYAKYKASKLGAPSVGLAPMTRNQAIKIIESYSGHQFQNPNGYDTDYLIARARAIQMSLPTFPYGNKTYNSNTGSIIIK